MGAHCHAIILTALSEEYQAIREQLRNLEEIVLPSGTIYEKGVFGEEQAFVAVAEIGAGGPGAAAEAIRAIDHFKPEVALFVGIAGGLKDVEIGDVVAATKVYAYEAGKAEASFAPRPEIGNSSYALVQRARAVKRQTEWLRRIVRNTASFGQPRAFVGAIAAGEKVIASTRSTVRKFLGSQYGDALAVEMEGHGFLKALQSNPQVEAMVVRGISDLIDGKSKADSSGSQILAARHASAFAFEILAQVRSHAAGADRGCSFDPTLGHRRSVSPATSTESSRILLALKDLELSDVYFLAELIGIRRAELGEGNIFELSASLKERAAVQGRLHLLSRELCRNYPTVTRRHGLG